jgi:hypothetical protein
MQCNAMQCQCNAMQCQCMHTVQEIFMVVAVCKEGALAITSLDDCWEFMGDLSTNPSLLQLE